MKKPLTEDIQYPLADRFTYLRHYTNGQINATLVNAAWRTAGGTTSSIRRSPGPPMPRKEKSYTRTLIRAVKENGDIEWPTGGGINARIEHLTGVFSAGSGGGWYTTDIVADYGRTAAVTAFLARYSLSSFPVNLDLRSQAEVKALNKLRGKAKLSDLDFGLLFGERRETAQLLAKALVGTAETMRAIAFKDPRKVAAELRLYFGVQANPSRERRRLLKVERQLKKELGRAPSLAQRAVAGMENAILIYNLGVTPLINDLKAGVAALSSPDVFNGFDVTAKAQYSRTVDDEVRWNWYGTKTKSVMTASETHGYTVTLRCRPVWTTQALLSRLGVTDLSLGWQLTRLSFLVDYELAVGPWLSALNALEEFEWIDGSYTQRVIRVLKLNTESDKVVSRGRSSGYGMVNHTKRTVYTTMPLPAPPMSRRIRNLSSQDARDAETKRALNKAALASRWIRGCIGGVFT